MHLEREELENTVRVHNDLGRNTAATSNALGIARSTVAHRLDAAVRKGIDPYIRGGVLPGGLELTGTSTYFPKQGNAPAQWVKTRMPGAPKFDPVPYLQDAFKEFEGLALNPPLPEATRDDLRTFYILADLHMGMYAWAQETGNAYDVEIADKIFTAAMMDLVQRAPASETAVLLSLGDFFHSDNNENRTLQSGNALDSDTRYGRVLRAGVDLMVQGTHLALQKHDFVYIRTIPGNHDPYGTLALNIALQSFFHDHPRVRVDPNPGPFYFNQFGKVLVGAAHGDRVKPHQFINTMAATVPDLWGKSIHRYAYLGHIHRKSMGAPNVQLGNEVGGAIWETFQTLAPRDAWGKSMGFTAGRSMQAITHHAETGEWDRKISSVIALP